MPQINIVEADVYAHRADLLPLFNEYITWVFEQFEASFGVDIQAQMKLTPAGFAEDALAKLEAPSDLPGVFFIVAVDGAAAGMGGLRGLTPTAAEVKRVYLRPQFRGLRLGEALLNRILDSGKALGYKSAQLDTAPYMQAAHRLYERFGFTDRAPYEGVDVPPEYFERWRFMEKVL